MKVLIQRSCHSLQLFKCLVSGLKCEECLRTTATSKCVKCDCVYCTQCFEKVRGWGSGEAGATCKCVKCDCVYCTQCFQKVRDGGGGALKIHSERNLEMGFLKFSDSLTFIDAYCFPV